MLYEAIDHVIMPVADPDAAAAPFQRLGLSLTPMVTNAGRGTRHRSFWVGSPAAAFYVEFLQVTHRERARPIWGDAFVDAAEQSDGLRTLMLRTPKLAEAVVELTRRSAAYKRVEVRNGEGATLAELAWLPDSGQACCDVRLVQYAAPADERLARAGADGLLTHALPLKRLDHLAAVARDLDADTRYWTDVLGVPLHGEIRTSTSIIRQLKIGDAILELLGPSTPDSPTAKRPPGLASVAAFEVTDMPAAVEQARAAGFTLPDPAPGAIPGTRTTTIAGTELSGLALQFLEYV